MDHSQIDTLINDARFKRFVPFLRLARLNLDTKPIVSYWCLFNILQQGLSSSVQDIRNELGKIMLMLETERTNRRGDPLFDSEPEAKKFIENYANQLLVKAENEAELGVSNADAIKLYLACANVSSLLPLFGDKSEENEKRIKYAKWKAVTISKMPKEPPPPPTTTTTSSDEPYEPEPDNDYSEDHNESSNDEPSVKPIPQPRHSVPSNPSTESVPEPSIESQFDFSKLSLTESQRRKAELYCESALYAIRNNDILTAVNNMNQSLHELQKYAQRNQK